MANVYSIDLEKGSTQYLEANDSVSLSPTGDLTIEMWVKFESLPGPATSTYYYYLAKRQTTNSYGLFTDYNNLSAGNYTLGMYINNGGGNFFYQILGTPSLGQWYHLAASFDASAATVEFMVDGISIGTHNIGGVTSIADTDSTVCIGHSGSGAFDFDGLIDEVRIWDITRTAAEINTNKAVMIDSASGLKASWHLENGLTDSSGNSNTLTNVNSAVFSTDVPFSGVTTYIKKVSGVAYAGIKKITGVAIANVKRIIGLG